MIVLHADIHPRKKEIDISILDDYSYAIPVCSSIGMIYKKGGCFNNLFVFVIYGQSDCKILSLAVSPEVLYGFC